MKLLHLDSSILGDNSVSRQLSAAIVAQVRGADAQVSYRDLVADPLPHLTLQGLPSDAADAGAEASAANAVLQQFLESDVVVIGAPMYNFTASTQLKSWIDRIVIAGKTFQYGANGPEGLVKGKRMIVGLSRGGLYGPGAPAESYEHLQSYLGAVFGFIGVQPEFIVAEGIAMGPEQRKAAVESALSAVVQLAA